MIHYIILHIFLHDILSFSVLLIFCSSLPHSFLSAVLSVGMLLPGLFVQIRISTRSRSGRGIFCPRPSRPLGWLNGDSAHKQCSFLFYFSHTYNCNKKVIVSLTAPCTKTSRLETVFQIVGSGFNAVEEKCFNCVY